MIVVKLQGGLGNQMFQYSLYRTLELLNKEVKLDVSYYDYSYAHNGIELEKVFNLKLDTISRSELKYEFGIGNINTNYKLLNKLLRKLILSPSSRKNHYKEVDHYFKSNISNYENAYLDGFWQSELYFKNFKREIVKDFTFLIEEEKLGEKNIKLLNQINNSNSVSIHIRGGDYLKHSSLGNVCNERYYNSAIKNLSDKIEKPNYYIFTDDYNYCKSILNIKDAVYVTWNKNDNSYLDMFLMSRCKHNIIANSSFSWWGAYLNKNTEKKVVMPNTWFNDKYSDITNIDWIKM